MSSSVSERSVVRINKRRQLAVSSSVEKMNQGRSHDQNPTVTAHQAETLRHSRLTVTPATAIRLRLLHSLGVIDGNLHGSPAFSCSRNCKEDYGTGGKTCLNSLPTVYEPLKGDHSRPPDDEMSLRTTTTEAATLNSASFEDSFSWRSFASLSSERSVRATTRCRRSVSFDDEVEVRLIPRRDAYSDRMKLLLWQSPSEMQENVARNCFEFASEEWDWQKVRLDEDMVEIEGGELIHPVHFMYNDFSFESAQLQDTRVKSLLHHESPDSDRELERDGIGCDI